ncbi:hypothetical protein ACP4OV_005720 [Aristida adscensionis]
MSRDFPFLPSQMSTAAGLPRPQLPDPSSARSFPSPPRPRRCPPRRTPRPPSASRGRAPTLAPSRFALHTDCHRTARLDRRASPSHVLFPDRSRCRAVPIFHRSMPRRGRRP